MTRINASGQCSVYKGGVGQPWRGGWRPAVAGPRDRDVGEQAFPSTHPEAAVISTASDTTEQVAPKSDAAPAEVHGVPAPGTHALIAQWSAQHPAFAKLAALDGVVLLSVERGQALLYAGHVARGVYLFLEGELALTAPCGCTEVVDTACGAFLFPPAGELNEESGRNAVVRRADCLIYVPRSWLITDPQLATSLSDMLVREVSARPQHDQHEAGDLPAVPASAAAPVAAAALHNSGPRSRGRLS